MKPTTKSVQVNIFLIYFLSENSLKQGDALLPLLFHLASEYAIREIQEIQVELILSGAKIKWNISAAGLC
jgi:hypothetical protein